MPGADTPIAFIASDADQRFTGGEPSSPISLRAVSPNGSAHFIYDWSAVDPAGASADELLASGEGSATQGSTTQGSTTQGSAHHGSARRFSAAAERGLYELFSTVTDSTGSVYVGRKLLRVGSVSGLDTSATHLGVVAGDPRVGGTDGQTLVQVNPRFGTAPYEVTWTTRSPDGGVDNRRLLALNSLASTFTSTDKTGTYIVTAEIVDSVGAAAVESVAVIVRDGPALEVSADRVSVLPRGGADGMVGLLATPIGGSEPFTYEWEIIGPDGARHNHLLWDTSVRDPIFESDASGTGVPASTRGVFVVRCAARGAFGTVLIGSTTIEVTDGISLAVYADRLTLPAGGAQAVLRATVRGAREPLSIVWRVSGPSGDDATSRLTNSTGAETRFAPDPPGAESGSYVVRCSVSDARGRTAADALVITVGEPLSAAVSADRTSPTIRGNAGFDSVRLKVRASGGTAPYAYQWFVQDPDDRRRLLGGLLGSFATANPTFSADTRLGPHTAWCVVTDADGTVAADGVTLNVGQPLNVEVAIDKPALGGLSPRGGVGGQGRLFGRAQGGAPPYTYNWEVVDANGVTDRSILSAASVADPIFTSTQDEGTYRATLTVTDALGAVFTDGVDVVVQEPAPVEANSGVGGGLRVEISTDRRRLQPIVGVATLQVDAIGGVEPISFEWEVINDNGAGEAQRLDVTTGAQVTFTAGALEGRYRVRCAAMDSAGQVARGSVQLEVTEAFDIALATSVTHLASGGVVGLSVELGGGTPNFTYSWRVLDENGVPAGVFANGATTTGEALQISVGDLQNQWSAPTGTGSSGTYRIVVTAVDADGLAASAAARVTVSDAFAVALSATETHLVPGDSVGLAATRVGGTAPITYVWSSFNSEGSFSGTFTEGSAGTGQAEQISEDDAANIWTAPLEGTGTTGRYEIQVTAIDADGDTFSDVVEVIVIEPLSLNLAAGNVVVAPSGSTMLIADRTGGEGPFTYAWTATDSNGQPAGAFITDSTDSGSAIQANQADDATNFWIAPIDTSGTTGLYDVTCTVVDSLGSVFADSIQIVVGLQDSLNADLSANRVFVPPGELVNLAVESVGGVGVREFTWQALNQLGVSAGTLSASTQTSATGAVTNAWTAPAAGTGTLGTYRIEVTVSDAAGAAFTDSVPIVVRSPLSLHLSAADILIPPSTSVSLSATPTGGEPPFTYTWSSKDGTGSDGGTFTSGSGGTGVAEQSGQDAGVSNTWRSTTNNAYTITCTVEDNIGQVFTDSITIVVTTEDVFSFDVTADKAVVGPGETVTLAGNQTSGFSPFTYTWNAQNESGGPAGTPSTLTQNNVVGDTTTTWVAPTGPTAEGTYNIACTVTDAGGKSFTDSISVKVSTLAMQNLFFDPATADTTSVLGTTLLTASPSGADPGQQIVAGFTNPVHPRNVVITIGDLNVSITGGTARVTGLDSRGLSRSEVITIGASTGVSTSHTGVVPFATVSQIDLFNFTGLTAFSDTVALGVGTKFGLTGKLNAASDVLYVNEAGTVLTSGYTVDATASQQGITFASAPNGARDYVVVFRVR